ncbi:MAG TPA: V-type ATP synthase subunit D [Bacilli bacterium]|jgi:V/A-type H+-transporting ATPase subunit D|nr:V-type ATP synthase subunit D [Bacilli bacterium]
MAQQVNHTRMELLRLKTKLATTRRGHKLLKDKQDEMIRQFMELVADYRQLKRRVQEDMVALLRLYNRARVYENDLQLFSKTLGINTTLNLQISTREMMGVKIPHLQKVEVIQPNKIAYSLNNSAGIFDDLLRLAARISDELIALASLEGSVNVLSEEINKTRRRVNAIEHIVIQELIDQVKVIEQKLADNELANTIRIMKSKDIIIKRNLEKSSQNRYEENESL